MNLIENKTEEYYGPVSTNLWINYHSLEARTQTWLGLHPVLMTWGRGGQRWPGEIALGEHDQAGHTAPEDNTLIS